MLAFFIILTGSHKHFINGFKLVLKFAYYLQSSITRLKMLCLNKTEKNQRFDENKLLDLKWRP